MAEGAPERAAEAAAADGEPDAAATSQPTMVELSDGRMMAREFEPARNGGLLQAISFSSTRTWFFSNLDYIARTLWGQEVGDPPKDATNFELRTKTLTRAAYASPHGGTVRASAIAASNSSRCNSARSSSPGFASARSARSMAPGFASARSATTPGFASARLATTPGFASARSATPGSASARSSAGAGFSSARSATTNGADDLLASARESPVGAGVYAKFQMSLENRAKVEQAHADKLTRDETRQGQARQQYEETQETRARMRGRNNRVKRQLVSRNLEQGRSIRQEREDNEMIIQHNRDELHAMVRAQVEKDKGGYDSKDSRLDAQEEAAQAAVREQHTREKQEWLAMANEKRQRTTEERRQAAEMIKQRTSAKTSTALESSRRRKAEEAAGKRADSAREARRKAQFEEERLSRAADKRTRIYQIRQSASSAREELTRRKQERVAQLQRDSRAEIDENERVLLASKQSVRDKIFSSRFVSRQAATQFDGSTFRKLYSMDDTADAEIHAANGDILNKIQYVEQRTDDEIDDDAAGEARYTFAAESKARKAAERRRIAQENAAQIHRLQTTEARTDNVLDTEAAAVRRNEMAIESKQRRKDAAKALEEENLAIWKRLKSITAATDDDVSDDAVGEARRQAAEASRARKKEEAERLARENAEFREQIANTGARTDDDVADDAAGAMRSVMASESKTRKAAEASKLAKKNAEMKRQLRNTGAVVDDDIDDDAAGMARKGYDIHHRNISQKL